MTQSNILMKTDTSDNWAKCENKYTPAEHTIIAYEDEGLPTRYKLSDGHTLLHDLPFINLIPETSTPQVVDEILTY